MYQFPLADQKTHVLLIQLMMQRTDLKSNWFYKLTELYRNIFNVRVTFRTGSHGHLPNLTAQDGKDVCVETIPLVSLN